MTRYYTQTPSDNTSFYRLYGVMQFIDDCHPIQILDWHTIAGCKNLVISRPDTADEIAFIEYAKDNHIKVIVDWDDDMLNWDTWNTAYPYYEKRRLNILKSLKLADELWVSTPAIAEVYKNFNQNIKVITNAYNDYLWKDPTKPGALKRCLWRGSPTHTCDMMSYDFIKLAQENEGWQFYTIGTEFDVFKMMLGKNYNWTGIIPLGQYFKFIRETNPNCFLFPLLDTKFNQAKSNIAWIEATLCGAAMFASKIGEFGIEPISDLKLLYGALEQNRLKYMKEKWEQSWEYIQDHLLLSKINELRKGSLL